MKLDNAQTNIKGRFVETTSQIPVVENLLRSVIFVAVLRDILAVGSNAHIKNLLRLWAPGIVTDDIGKTDRKN